MSVPTMNTLPLSALLRPELPPAALYGLPGRVATELATSTGADPAALLVMFLTVLGNVAGAQPHVEFGGAQQPGRLFTLIVGDAATGRKGTAWEAVEHLFREVDPDWADTRVLFGVKSAEAVVARVAGERDPRLMVVETEYARLVRVMAQAAGLSDQFRNAWDGRTMQTVVKNSRQSQVAKGAHVSILGMITPGELLRLHDRMRNAGGLESRILYCFSAPPDVEISPFRDTRGPVGLATEVQAALGASQDAVMAQTDPVSAWLCTARGRQPRAVLPVGEEIRARWLRVVRDHLPTVDVSLGPFWSRAETHVIRLAACYALADQSRVITAPHIGAALALWEFCAASAERIFGIPVGDLPPRVKPTHSAQVARYLYDQYPGWVTAEQARTHTLGTGVSPSMAEQVLTSLVTTGVAQRRTEPDGGAGYRLLMVSGA